jgi:hypothetical protein
MSMFSSLSAVPPQIDFGALEQGPILIDWTARLADLQGSVPSNPVTYFWDVAAATEIPLPPPAVSGMLVSQEINVELTPGKRYRIQQTVIPSTATGIIRETILDLVVPTNS